MTDTAHDHDRPRHGSSRAAGRARSGLRHDGRSAHRASIATSIRATPIISARPAAAPSSPPIRRNISRQDERAAEPVPEGTIYTCPMHPEIRQVGPGSCPICGMALEPEIVDRRDRAQSRTRRHDAALLDRPRADAAGVRARDGRAHRRRRTASSIRRCRTGFSSRSRRRWCCGPAGRSSCAAGSRSSRAISTCSR